MSEYGEPWSVKHLGGVRYELVDRSGKELNQDAIRRIVACVNALSGIRNPAAVKDVIMAARDICEEGFHDFMWVSDRINVTTKAIAALDGEAG